MQHLGQCFWSRIIELNSLRETVRSLAVSKIEKFVLLGSHYFLERTFPNINFGLTKQFNAPAWPYILCGYEHSD